MRRNRNGRDLPAILAGTVSLALAVGVVVIMKQLKLQDNEAITVALLLVPLLVYGIVSGRLKELRAPGGWGAMFSRTVKNKIAQHEITLVKPIPVSTTFREPSRHELKFHPNAFQVAVKDSIAKVDICKALEYIGSRLASEVVRYVIFVDSSELFLSMLPVTSISKRPELIAPDGDCEAYQLVWWINNKDIDMLSDLEGYVSSDDAVSSGFTKRQCLKKMVQLGVEALPVV